MGDITLPHGEVIANSYEAGNCIMLLWCRARYFTWAGVLLKSVPTTKISAEQGQAGVGMGEGSTDS